MATTEEDEDHDVPTIKFTDDIIEEEEPSSTSYDIDDRSDVCRAHVPPTTKIPKAMSGTGE